MGRLLVPKLHGLLQEAFDRKLEAFDLTTRQANLLASCELGEALTQTDLARIYSLDASSINRLVDRLVKKGFLLRKRSKADRRLIFLQITPLGSKCLWEAVPEATQLAKQVWHGVTEDERAALASIVDKVSKNLETSGPPQHLNKNIKEFS